MKISTKIMCCFYFSQTKWTWQTRAQPQKCPICWTCPVFYEERPITYKLPMHFQVTFLPQINSFDMFLGRNFVKFSWIFYYFLIFFVFFFLECSGKLTKIHKRHENPGIVFTILENRKMHQLF